MVTVGIFLILTGTAFVHVAEDPPWDVICSVAFWVGTVLVLMGMLVYLWDAFP